jgi:Gpi18-like mannosyltransferase
MGRSFIDVWLRWDAVHYMNIAKFGYQGVGKGEMIFFPLYPYLVGFLSRILTIDVTLTGILVSSFFTILALICFYDLVLYLFSDKDLARYSILLFALYPMAFFLHAPFTDALFMFFSISSILMMVKKKYFFAGVFGCFAGLARAQGVLLLIPMCAYLVEDHWRENTHLNWQKILAVCLIPSGFVGFIFWRTKAGVPGIFKIYQNYSGAIFQDPISNLIKSSAITFQYPSYCRIAEVFSALLFLIILIWMFTKSEFRKHAGIMLYSAATWIVVISKSGVAGYGLQSVNRYVLHIFFAYVGMAFFVKGQSQKINNLLMTGLISLSLINLILYSLWIFVG